MERPSSRPAFARLARHEQPGSPGLLVPLARVAADEALGESQ